MLRGKSVTLSAYLRKGWNQWSKSLSQKLEKAKKLNSKKIEGRKTIYRRGAEIKEIEKRCQLRKMTRPKVGSLKRILINSGNRVEQREHRLPISEMKGGYCYRCEIRKTKVCLNKVI